MNKLKIIAVIAAFTSSNSFAQETVLSTGGDGAGAGGSVSYSLGQISYTTATGSNGSMAAGVQQAYEISVVGFDEVESEISLIIYPNPTSDFLTLNIETPSFSQLNYSLVDMNGQLISSGKLLETNNTIDLGDLPQSTYLLSVIENQKTIKSFQIIKLK